MWKSRERERETVFADFDSYWYSRLLKSQSRIKLCRGDQEKAFQVWKPIFTNKSNWLFDVKSISWNKNNECKNVEETWK